MNLNPIALIDEVDDTGMRIFLPRAILFVSDGLQDLVSVLVEPREIDLQFAVIVLPSDRPATRTL